MYPSTLQLHVSFCTKGKFFDVWIDKLCLCGSHCSNNIASLDILKLKFHDKFLPISTNISCSKFSSKQKPNQWETYMYLSLNSYLDVYHT